MTWYDDKIIFLIIQMIKKWNIRKMQLKGIKRLDK